MNWKKLDPWKKVKDVMHILQIGVLLLGIVTAFFSIWTKDDFWWKTALTVMLVSVLFGVTYRIAKKKHKAYKKEIKKDMSWLKDIKDI